MAEGERAEIEEKRSLPSDTGLTKPEEFPQPELQPANDVLSESVSVSDTTNGYHFNFIKTWKRPARFVRFKVNQTSVVKYRLQPRGNILTYPGSLSANRWLRMNETVYELQVIPSSSATLNIMASSGAAFVEED